MSSSASIPATASAMRTEVQEMKTASAPASEVMRAMADFRLAVSMAATMGSFGSLKLPKTGTSKPTSSIERCTNSLTEWELGVSTAIHWAPSVRKAAKSGLVVFASRLAALKLPSACGRVSGAISVTLRMRA